MSKTSFVTSWKKVVYVLSVRYGAPKLPSSCPGAAEDLHGVVQVDREAQLTLREIVSKDQWVEDVLRKKKKNGKTMRNGWQEHGSGASDSVGGSQQCVAGLDLSRKSIEKATKLLISSHELLETPRIPTSFLGIGLIWFNHAREKIVWLTPLQLYFPTLQRIAQRASIFIAFFSHADWHIGSNRLLQSGRLILGKVIAQCEARQSHQDILRVWRWKTCGSSFDSKWLWTFIVKGGMSHIVTFYHAESQITKSISRLQTEVWIIDSWNITSSWHPVSLTVASGSCDLIILMSFKSMGLVEQTSRVSCGSSSINFGDPEILENPVVISVRNLIIWGSWFWTHTISSTWHSHRFPVLTSGHQAEQQPLCFPDSWHPRTLADSCGPLAALAKVHKNPGQVTGMLTSSDSSVHCVLECIGNQNA